MSIKSQGESSGPEGSAPPARVEGSSGNREFSGLLPRQVHNKIMDAVDHAPGWQQLTLQSIAEISTGINHILDILRPLGYSERDLFGIRLALEEAVVNAIKHGHHSDTAKTVRVRYHITDLQFLAEIQDEGSGFDPDGVPDPLDPENLERPGGRGIFLMRHYMTWVSFNECGNCVTMCHRRSP